MQKIRFLLFLAGMVLLSCGGPASDKTVPTLILFNGKFFTGTANKGAVSAIAIQNDRILALGSDADIKKMAGKETQLVDLQGKFAMSGFIEGHGHFQGLGESLHNLNLIQTKSWAEIVSMTAEKAKSAAPGDWIEGRGWHQEKWTESPGPTVNGYPYNTALDSASPNNPLVLYHASGHGLIANSRAIELAGISRETADPVGGRIVRDARGTITGVFEENAMDLVLKPLNEWANKRSETEKAAAFDKNVSLAAEACLKKGITSFQDAGSNFWELAQYRRLAENAQLPLRLWVMASQPQSHELSKLAEYPQIGLGKGFFTCRAVKCYLDGALGSYGAWLLAPYDDKPGFTGQNTTPLDTIARIAGLCRQHGLQLCVHAIGDRANREVLNLMEHAFGAAAADYRWRIEHAQHIDVQDIPRFAQLGVVASMQAIHCTSDAPFVAKRLGTERARTGAYAWRSLLDKGAHLANGTDTPVEDVDPLPCIYASVTRRRPDSGLEFFTEQKMSREEALLSYTLWNAWAAFEEKEKGTLEAGKLADIVVLDTDLLGCAPEEILKAKVLKVVLGGKLREF